MDKKNFIVTKKAIEHLKHQDPRMGRLIDTVGTINREIIDDPFIALVYSIVFQQLAYSAANTIWNKLLETTEAMMPQVIYELSDDVLRECGLSRQKIKYIKNIAKAFLDKRITNEMLLVASDETIINQLVSIKGIGTWTAEMFLIFCLHREDIFSYKDLALRKGIQWLYELDDEPSEIFCNTLIEKWKPYNTVASFYLWEITIQKYFNFTPNELLYSFLNNETLCTSYLESPLCILKIVTSNKGLEILGFADDIDYNNSNNDTYLMKQVKTQLREYFDGKRKNFDLPIYYNGTKFQKSVWQALNTIPYGVTKSYGEIAKIIGNHKASRAVGGANNKNKIGIILPCHRVIGANGALVGYDGGLDKKKWLLDHEMNNG